MAPQLEHVRAAVLESAEIFWPAPHVGWAVHEVPRLSPILYVLAPQSEHVRLAVLESAEIFLPAPHVGCAAHVVSRWRCSSRQMHGCVVLHDPVPEKPCLLYTSPSPRD